MKPIRKKIRPLPSKITVRSEFLLHHSDAAIARDFLTFCHDYAQLVDEVKYVLVAGLEALKVEGAQVSGRVKTLQSFQEKLHRKKYRRPFDDVTDIAGVRVVCLHPHDLDVAVSVVKQCFTIVEEVRKAATELDRFGYQAIHFVVQLKEDISGIRFYRLSRFRCEIQLRTVMQDAWSIIDHHLRYKRENQVPHKYRRDVHALAAVLENADSRFAEIALERRRYISYLNNGRTMLASILKEQTNQDSLLAYLRKQFPKFRLGYWQHHAHIVLDHFDFARYPTLRDVHKVMQQTEFARARYKRDSFSQIALAHFALAFSCVDKDYRKATLLGEEAHQVLRYYLKRSKLKS